MKYKLSIYQRMLQKMAMTPQMRQSIQMLGMTTKELIEYIDSVVEKNPLLKKEFDKKRTLTPSPSLPADYEEKPIVQDENPRSSLLSQVRMLNLKSKTLEIAEYLIYEMDDNGYIQIDTEEAANDLFASTDEVEEALSIIQGMEPAGIGARDVRECLQLQLKRVNKEDSLEYSIVTDFINELATDDAKKISEGLNVDEKKVREAIKNIKKLNPRPASTLLGDKAEPVIPDLIASIKNDKIRLELNREWLPRLRLYNPYKNDADIIKDPEAREFLEKNMNAAKHLLDGLKRREETMCRVANYILGIQKESLNGDENNIETLTIRDVADELNLHPSTISRTVSNKYIQIKDKVVPLRSLLSHGIKKENGDLTSKTSIKNKIRELIDNEDKAKPLNDNTIKEKLELEGIGIKRRTVAKYRESLRILPVHLRRRR